MLGVGSAWRVLHGAGHVSLLCPAGDREVLKKCKPLLMLQLRVPGTARALSEHISYAPPLAFSESVQTSYLLKACFVRLTI